MESSTTEVSIDVQQQKICSLIDFVMNCNRNHRFTSRMLEPENSYVSMMKDAVLDSAIIVDSLTVLSPSEDENEIVNVPNEDVEDNLPKFNPPRKGLSAVRSFPPGCGRGGTPVRNRHGLKYLQNTDLVRANRVVVQALNAAPNCPWMLGKRMFKSKPTNRSLEAFSRYAPLNVQPLKSDSLISADVKLALLHQ